MGSLTAPTSRLRFASADLAIPLFMSYLALADAVQAPVHHDTALSTHTVVLAGYSPRCQRQQEASFTRPE